ncbi:MAG: hypothetical protein B7733_04640 [Myxococcales bacterium FL481]|nr:MAG: hypothetical protein B7733_04640 [Myxococcales bacterium FL481]
MSSRWSRGRLSVTAGPSQRRPSIVDGQRSERPKRTTDPFASWLPPRPDGDPLRLLLAPMDGVTEHVHRALISELNPVDTTLDRRLSAVDVCVSEFVRVTDHVVPVAVLWRHCPELRAGGMTRSGVPVFVQLLGSAPVELAATARRAVELGARGIDLNFGCPAKTVNRHDGGATLLRAPSRVERITAAVRAAVPPELPVTVKIRVGWDSSDPVESLAAAAEQGGAAWLTIHGRTRAQGYRPPVDWPAIGRAAAAVQIPVVANGDLHTPQDVAQCRYLTGCAAFMVGRGIMAAPNWFRWVRGLDSGPPDLPGLCSVWRRYAAQLRDSGASGRSALCRLKQWLRMAAAQRTDVVALFDRVKREMDVDAVLNVVAALECRRRSSQLTISASASPGAPAG